MHGIYDRRNREETRYLRFPGTTAAQYPLYCTARYLGAVTTSRWCCDT
eukprot:COSAG01_NODE_65809_length_272_cov_0.601156_1_plen_48_part_01